MTAGDFLIPNAAVRAFLSGVPEQESDDPEMIAVGPFVVEHDPPVRGRAQERACQLERHWNGQRVDSPTWHRFWRVDTEGIDGTSTGTDNAIDHWFEVGAWRVDEGALVIERADRVGTIRFREFRPSDEGRWVDDNQHYR